LSNIKEIFSAQRTFFKTGATLSYEYRFEQLHILYDAVKKNEKDVLQALAADLGRTTKESYLAELVPVYEEIKLFKKNLKSWMRPQSVSTPIHLLPANSKVFPEPYGVVSIFAPWNYPFQLLMTPMVGAIGTGNTMILKGSEYAPNVQKIMEKIIAETFSPNYIAYISGGIEQAKSILQEKSDFLFFTGSPRVGQIVMQAAAKHLTPVCLELGGKCPAIVDLDANLEIAAKRIAWAKYFNAGQTCAAPDYLYVHQSVEQELIEKIHQEVIETFGKKPMDSPLLAKIINAKHFQRLSSLFSVQELEFGGASSVEKNKIEPSLLRIKSWEHPLMQEEIFGPILPVLSFQNIEDLVGSLKDRDKPLALYYFSTDSSKQDYVLQNTSSGGACINDCFLHLANPNLPFGGVGKSGMGAYHGKQSFDTLSHKKSILTNKNYLDNPLRYSKSNRFKDWIVKNWL